MLKGDKNLYYRLPVFFQNIAVTAYGWRLRRRRYGSNAGRYLDSLLVSERYSADEMMSFVDAHIRDAVRHALATVPFYKEWARENGAEPEDFGGLPDLKKLPIVTKQMITSRPDAFFSCLFVPIRGLIHLSTSGTSGTPLTVVCDNDTRTHHYAFFSRLRSWFGLTSHDRRATLFGRAIVSPRIDTPPFWRYDAAQRNLLLSSYHLAPKNLPHYVRILREFEPAEVIGYPSSIHQIARHIVETGNTPLQPKVVFTTAETLLSYQREIIQQAFNAPLVDQYGCTEMAFFASQCEDGTMHVHPEHGVLETLDDAQRAAPVGSPGHCVATGFINPVMPLLRYNVGDMITLSDRFCSCGRPFPVIDQIEGRIDDILATPEGRPIGRLDPVFKGHSGVAECQIVQTSPDTIELNIVPNRDFCEDTKRRIRKELHLRVGPTMKIRIECVENIPRGANGKFKAVERRF